MTQLLDPLLILVLAINFFALGVSRIRSVIHAVAELVHRLNGRLRNSAFKIQLARNEFMSSE